MTKKQYIKTRSIMELEIDLLEKKFKEQKEMLIQVMFNFDFVYGPGRKTASQPKTRNRARKGSNSTPGKSRNKG